jgi:cation transport ATPase
MKNKRQFYIYIRNSGFSFIAIVLLYLVFTLLNLELFMSNRFILALLVFTGLFLIGWAIMLPSIYKNPKELIVSIISLYTIQMLLFMVFAAAMAFSNSETEVVFDVLCMFLPLNVLNVFCIIHTLKSSIT